MLAERWFVVIALLVLLGVLTQRGAWLQQAVWHAVSAGMVVLILLHRKIILHAARKSLSLLAFGAVVIASTAWSVDPELTVEHSITFGLVTLFGLYLAARYTPRESMQLLAWALGTMIVLSAAFGLYVPHRGIMGGIHEGAWRGILTHKNNLGNFAALSTVLFVLLGLARPSRWIVWALAAASAALVLLSTSRTALTILAAALVLIPILQLLRLRTKLLIPAVAACMIVGGLIVIWLGLNREELLVSLGRDVTLTGRTELWTAVANAINERPWLGYGYHAFWARHVTDSNLLREEVGWKVGHAHNGFLDLWLSVGAVGLLAFLLVFCIAVRHSMSILRSGHDIQSTWPLVFLAFTVLSNLTEGYIHHWMHWTVFVAVVAGSRLYTAPNGLQPLRPAGNSSTIGAPKTPRKRHRLRSSRYEPA